MKKFLSLVLALVMTMSLVTISAGAKDFTDNNSIAYKEAVDVMSGVSAIDGYTDGTFNPSATLTRGAAAKIICNLILGPTTAGSLGADAAPFQDVPANHTFAGQIAYCAQQKIISGYADGTFRPAGTVTGYQFMKMLLVALGYDSAVENFTGPNWSVNVAKLALSIGLDEGNDEFVGTAAVTREEACLYAFNTMTADMVAYDTTGSSIIVGGVEIVTNPSKAEAKTTTSTTSYNADDDKIVQFCEQYFTKLKLAAGTSDAFGRPSNQWEFKNEKVGTYSKKADESYTAEVKGGKIYTDLNKGAILDVDTSVFINGAASTTLGVASSGCAIARNNEKKIGGTGALTEVFYDAALKKVKITIVDTYLAQVSGEYDTKKEELSVDGVSNGISGKLSADDFDNLDTYEDEDYVLVTVTSAGNVESIVPAEKVSGTVTSFTTDDSVTAGGTKYSYNRSYDDAATQNYSIKEDYDLYLDTYGNVLFADGVEAAGNYVYITDGDSTSNLPNAKIVAGAYLTDGTYDEIVVAKVDGKKATTVNTVAGWYTYSIKNEQYNLTAVAVAKVVSGTPADATKITEKGKVNVVYSAALTKKATNSTVFVVADKDNKVSVYTGIKNVPTLTTAAVSDTNVAVVLTSDGGSYAKYVFIDLGAGTTKGSSKSSDSIFVLKASYKTSVDENDNTYYTYDAVVNGEKTKVNANATAIFGTVGLYTEVTYDADKYADTATLVDSAYATANDEDFTYQSASAATVTEKGGVVSVAAQDYFLADGAKIYVIDGTDVTTVSAKKLASDYDGADAAHQLTAVVTSTINTDGEYTALYVNVTTP